VRQVAIDTVLRFTEVLSIVDTYKIRFKSAPKMHFELEVGQRFGWTVAEHVRLNEQYL
jgi:hypothetical protein